MAFAEANRDVRAVIGNDEVLRSIRAVYGGAMAERLNKWMTNFEQNGEKNAAGYGVVARYVNGMLAPSAITALGGKVGVLMKQFSAFLGSMIEIPAPAAVRSMGRMLAGRLSTSLPETWNSPTIQRRIEAGFSPAIRAVMNRGGFNPGVLLMLAEKGMAPIGFVDAAFTTFSAATAYDYHFRDAKRNGMDDKAAIDYAADKMDEVVRRTAQPASLTDRSSFEATSDPLWRGLMMFMSEARQKFAISYLAAKRLARGEDRRMNTQKIAVAWFLMALVTQTMGNIYRDLFTDDESEEIWTREGYYRALALGPINGLLLAGGFITDMASWLTGARVFQDSRTPLDGAGEAMRKKKFNPENWNEVDEVIDGMRLINQSISTISGQASLAAPSIILNPAKDAIGLYGNLREAIGGPDDATRILRAGREFAKFRNEDAQGMGDDRKRIYRALTSGNKKAIDDYIAKKLTGNEHAAARVIVMEHVRGMVQGLSPYRVAAGSREKIPEFKRWAATKLTAQERAELERMEAAYKETLSGLKLR
jgi:hypothetical protein